MPEKEVKLITSDKANPFLTTPGALKWKAQLRSDSKDKIDNDKCFNETIHIDSTTVIKIAKSYAKKYDFLLFINGSVKGSEAHTFLEKKQEKLIRLKQKVKNYPLACYLERFYFGNNPPNDSEKSFAISSLAVKDGCFDESTFTSFEALINKLIDVGYIKINKNSTGRMIFPISDTIIEIETLCVATLDKRLQEKMIANFAQYLHDMEENLPLYIPKTCVLQEIALIQSRMKKSTSACAYLFLANGIHTGGVIITPNKIIRPIEWAEDETDGLIFVDDSNEFASPNGRYDIYCHHPDFFIPIGLFYHHFFHPQNSRNDSCAIHLLARFVHYLGNKSENLKKILFLPKTYVKDMDVHVNFFVPSAYDVIMLSESRRYRNTVTSIIQSQKSTIQFNYDGDSYDIPTLLSMSKQSDPLFTQTKVFKARWEKDAEKYNKELSEWKTCSPDQLMLNSFIQFQRQLIKNFPLIEDADVKSNTCKNKEKINPKKF